MIQLQPLFFLNSSSPHHIQLILFICGFRICKFTKFKLAKICNPKINTQGTFVAFQRCAEQQKTRVTDMHIPAEGEQVMLYLFVSALLLINKCLFQHLFRAMFFVFLCFLLVGDFTTKNGPQAHVMLKFCLALLRTRRL